MMRTSMLMVLTGTGLALVVEVAVGLPVLVFAHNATPAVGAAICIPVLLLFGLMVAWASGD